MSSSLPLFNKNVPVVLRNPVTIFFIEAAGICIRVALRSYLGESALPFIGFLCRFQGAAVRGVHVIPRICEGHTPLFLDSFQCSSRTARTSAD